ncbi:MAG: M15 family metallopeptidase [Lachnospiraceae bacterium]|nr:M15 family metallopeptidase [Lachnospiraceae bacterium]
MKAIPKTDEPERYTAVSFSGSPFVELKSCKYFDVRMMYPVLGMKHAEERCFVRAEVFDMLKSAAKAVPEGYRLRIWDAWRPFALQKELYLEYSEDIIERFGLKDCSKAKQEAFVRKFVSDPIEDAVVPPVHTTGGAVDVTLIDEKGVELDMGTGFDAFTELTDTASFEGKKNRTVRDNRRLLYSVMTEAGFTNLPSEWWHYDYGDRFWAYYNRKPALYEGIFTLEELLSGSTK